MKRTDKGFKVEPYKFLSNMQPCKITLYDMVFPSVENAYQASKCMNMDEVHQFVTCNPYESKRLGKTVKMHPNFNQNKLHIMEQLLRQKFSDYNPVLKQKLIDTGDTELIEVNNWSDFYWGICNGTGENHLGKLLMKIRDELITSNNNSTTYGYTTEQWSKAIEIYNQLGPKTVNEGSRVQILEVYGRQGVNKAKELNAIFTLRVPDMKYHLGNPYTSHKDIAVKDNLVLTKCTRDSVLAYICWVLYDQSHRAIMIRIWLYQGRLKGKSILYYKELGEPSHATALEWLIDNYHLI